jgi:serine/threonine protein kinase
VDTDAPALLAGRYELGTRLGGGAARVVAARDLRLDRDVAIKLFPHEWSADESLRFDREARLAATLMHPNVVLVYDVGTADEVSYIVMEYMPRGSLADALRRGPLSPARVSAVLADVLAGLGAAHALGILHRDLKPANILFDGDGRAKLADFGIATTAAATDLTMTGSVLGTPQYLAPERVAGNRATVESDLYAVGVVGYEALTGSRPFTGDTPIAVAYAIHHSAPEPLQARRPDAPPDLTAAIEKAMARDPTDRFADAPEFARALPAQDDTDPTRPMPLVEPTRAQRAVSPTTPVSALSRSRARRRGAGLAAFGVALALAIGGVAFAAARTGSSTSGNRTPPVSVPAPLRAPFDNLEHAVSR